MDVALGITGPLAALAAGLVTSLHCAGMCGPLACAVTPAGRGPTAAWSAGLLYHGGRLLSYTLLGMAAGLVGSVVLDGVGAPPAQALLWTFLVVFGLFAVGADRWLPKPRRLGIWLMPRLARFRGRREGAAVLGLATPFLPCGPLYLVAWVAAASGSALAGGLLLLAFALGTVPLLGLVQFGFKTVTHRLGPSALFYLQRGLAGLCVAFLAWRGWPLLTGGAAGFRCCG